MSCSGVEALLGATAGCEDHHATKSRDAKLSEELTSNQRTGERLDAAMLAWEGGVFIHRRAATRAVWRHLIGLGWSSTVARTRSFPIREPLNTGANAHPEWQLPAIEPPTPVYGRPDLCSTPSCPNQHSHSLSRTQITLPSAPRRTSISLRTRHINREINPRSQRAWLLPYNSCPFLTTLGTWYQASPKGFAHHGQCEQDRGRKQRLPQLQQ